MPRIPSPLAFLHDSDAFEDPKLQGLMAFHGSDGYMAYFVLLEQMRKEEADGLRLPFSRIPGLAYKLRLSPDKLTLIIEDGLTLGLFVSDEEHTHFWSAGLRERITRYNESKGKTSESRRNAAIVRWQKHRTCNANASPPDANACGHNANASQIDADAMHYAKVQVQDQGTCTDHEVPEDPPHPFLKYFNLKTQDLSSGRYALDRYQWMWMHPQELQDAREQWERAGMTLEEWRAGCRACNVALEGKKHDHRLKGGLALLYLTTHILTNALEQKRKELDVRSRTGESPKTKRAPVRLSMPQSQPETAAAILSTLAPKVKLP